MPKQTLKTPPKISVQIWVPVIDRLNEKVEAACLRRDAYLNRVLDVELPELDAEVSIANSEVARKYVAERLEALPRKVVSLSLRPDLVERLNDICTRKRIVRDAFFNRLFLLLAASPKLIDLLYFAIDEDWREEIWADHRNDGPFYQNGFNQLEPDIDPLWALRTSLALFAERVGKEDWINPETGESIQIERSLAGVPHPVNSIYTSPFNEAMFKDADVRGLNVYLRDSWVPDTEAAKAERKTLDQMIF
jgi:hypothetical protein